MSEAAAKPEATRKTGAHRRRSSREAIDSLGVPEGGSAEPTPAHHGVRTPAELKNPFQQQP